jgi:hypothetical protein
MGDPGELLTGNLAALSAANGTTPDLGAGREQVRAEEGQRGATLVLERGSGRAVLLHSRRDPLDEAHRLLDATLGSRPLPSLVVLLGVGLGYVIDAIEARSDRTKIVAIETEPACLHAMLARRDLAGAIRAGRLLLLWGPEYRGWSEGWRFWDGLEDEPLTIAHPVLRVERPDAHQAAEAVRERMAYGAKANAAARARFAGPYLFNTLRNLPAIAASADVRELNGACTGIPAIVAAAGPSLDRNLADLKAAQERAIIVSVDTALRPLLAAGIVPHFVVGVDLQESNARNIAGLGSGARSRLVAEGSLDPIAFPGFEGRIYTFRVADHQPWPLLRALGLDRGLLRAWGSVLITAQDLALQMGCNPIIMVGADLAYTDGQPYCRNTLHEAAWAAGVREGKTLAEVWSAWLTEPPGWATGVDGTRVRTAPHLIAFRDWLVERSTTLPEIRFVNATGGGILHGGRVELLSVPDALSRCPNRPAHVEMALGRIDGRRGARVAPPGPITPATDNAWFSRVAPTVAAAAGLTSTAAVAHALAAGVATYRSWVEACGDVVARVRHESRPTGDDDRASTAGEEVEHQRAQARLAMLLLPILARCRRALDAPRRPTELDQVDVWAQAARTLHADAVRCQDEAMALRFDGLSGARAVDAADIDALLAAEVRLTEVIRDLGVACELDDLPELPGRPSCAGRLSTAGVPREVGRTPLPDRDGTPAEPYFIARNSHNHLFVSLYGRGTVVRLDGAGRPVAELFLLASGRGALRGPLGLAVDGQDRLWVVEHGASRVRVVDSLDVLPAGSEVDVPTAFAGGLHLPSGIASAPGGAMLVAEHGAHRITSLTTDGHAKTFCGVEGQQPGALRCPTDLLPHVPDPSVGLWAVDHRNHRLQLFDWEGRFVRQVGRPGRGSAEFLAPCYLAQFASGVLAVSQYQFTRCLKLLSPDGEEISCLRTDYSPGGLLATGETLAVVDRTGNAIRFYDCSR